MLFPAISRQLSQLPVYSEQGPAHQQGEDIESKNAILFKLNYKILWRNKQTIFSHIQIKLVLQILWKKIIWKYVDLVTSDWFLDILQTQGTLYIMHNDQINLVKFIVGKSSEWFKLISSFIFFMGFSAHKALRELFLLTLVIGPRELLEAKLFGF